MRSVSQENILLKILGWIFLLFPVEAGITHFGNDAQLAAGLAEGIAGESSVLGEFAEHLGKFFWFFHGIGNFVFVN